MQALGVREPVGRVFMERRIVADAPRGHHRDHDITLYGITNCDTVKRARAWLAEHGVDYRFHDFKKEGVPEAELDRWLRAAGLGSAGQPPRHHLAQARRRDARGGGRCAPRPAPRCWPTRA